MTENTREPMMTTKEVAAFLRVHEVTVLRWRKAGYLAGSRLGPGRTYRFSREDVESAYTRGLLQEEEDQQ